MCPGRQAEEGKASLRPRAPAQDRRAPARTTAVAAPAQRNLKVTSHLRVTRAGTDRSDAADGVSGRAAELAADCPGAERRIVNVDVEITGTADDFLRQRLADVGAALAAPRGRRRERHDDRARRGGRRAMDVRGGRRIDI